MEYPLSEPKTLLQLAGADLEPPMLADSCLVLIDYQNEYLDGPIAVDGAEAAVANAHALLQKARAAGSTVIHVVHKGKSDSLFDRDQKRGQLIDGLSPQGNEKTIEKTLPNAFAGTELASEIASAGHGNLIVIGFMTHMCVSSTARAALDLGHRISIDAACCATRSLPDGKGGVIPAGTLHEVALAELSDRFALIIRDHQWR